MKRMIMALLLGLFAFGAHAQEDRTAPVYDVTRPNSKTTAQIMSMTRMVEGSEAWNSETDTMWRYVLGVWIDTGISGDLSSTDIDTFAELDAIVADETLSKASDIGVTVQPYNANTDTDSTDDITQGANAVSTTFTIAEVNGPSIRVNTTNNSSELNGGNTSVDGTHFVVGEDGAVLFMDSNGAAVDYIFDLVYDTDNDVARKVDVDAAISGSVGSTNLSYTAATRTVASDTGTDAIISLADGTNPGLMSSAFYTTLGYITLSNPLDLDALEFQVAGKWNTADVVTNLSAPSNDEVPTTEAVDNAITAAIDANNLLGEIEITSSRTALLTDKNGAINVNSASAVTYTVPENASVSFPIGTLLALRQENTGTITIAYSGAATGPTTSTYKQGQTITLWKTATDVWEHYGEEPKPEEVKVLTVPITGDGVDLATATNISPFFQTQDITVTGVYASVNVAPTGSVATFDVNIDGVSILSTEITIDAGEKTSNTAAAPPVISNASISAWEEWSFDIDGVGSSTPGTTGTIYITYTLD